MWNIPASDISFGQVNKHCACWTICGQDEVPQQHTNEMMNKQIISTQNRVLITELQRTLQQSTNN